MTKARDNATQGGLVLINSTNLTSSSSVSFNNCFSSNYENYRIIFNIRSIGTNQDARIRLRASGLDYSASNYYETGFSGTDGGTTTIQFNASPAQSWVVGYSDGGNSTSTIDIYSPNATTTTSMNGLLSWGVSGSNTLRVSFFGGRLINSDSFDGFTLFPSGGSITGTVKIYGYK